MGRVGEGKCKKWCTCIHSVPLSYRLWTTSRQGWRTSWAMLDTTASGWEHRQCLVELALLVPVMQGPDFPTVMHECACDVHMRWCSQASETVSVQFVGFCPLLWLPKTQECYIPAHHTSNQLCSLFGHPEPLGIPIHVVLCTSKGPALYACVCIIWLHTYSCTP